jgi:hypothetical protein
MSRSVLRSRQNASPFGMQFHRAAWSCRSRACALLVVFLGAGWLSGCQSYNPNLGAPSAQSSALTLMTPSGKRAGDPDFTLTISGLGFVAGSVVQWNGSNRATTVVDATQVTASITAADIANAGTFSVRVMTPGPTDGNNFSNILPFLVCSGACPQNVAGGSGLVSALSTGDGGLSPAISADQRYVAYASASADPSANAGSGLRKIYVRDTCTGAPSGCAPQTALVSVAWHGGEPNGDSHSPSISADGRYVAFVSDATDIIESDSNGVSDIFVRDTCAAATQGCTPATLRVSLGPGGIEANGSSGAPSISADGRYVAFDSEAHNLVNDGSSAPTGAFVYDTCHGAAAECVPSIKRLAISAAPAR